MTNQKPDELSEREREILRLVATGASNKEIAQRLVISPNTVKVHLRNIFGKIGAASRTEAAMYAVRVGLVEQAQAVQVQEIPIQSQITGMFVDLPVEETDLVIPVSHSEPDSVSSPVPVWRKRLFLLGMFLLVVIMITVLIGIVRLRKPVYVNRTSETITQTPLQVQSPTPFPRWKDLADLPTARSGLAAATYEDQIYVVGGKTSNHKTGILERYNPETDKWQFLSSKPLAVDNVQAGFISGQFIVPGGDTEDGQPSAQVDIYNPRLDTWTQAAQLPIPLSAYAMASLEGNLYLFGGWDGKHFTNRVFVYLIAQDEWQERTPMPTARGFSSAAVASGRIYIFGGKNDQQVLATNEIYQPNNEGSLGTPWTEAPSLPSPRYAAAAVGMSDFIYIFGGKGPAGTEPLPLQYIPRPGTWNEITTPDPVLGSDLALASLNTQVYLLGGEINTQPTSRNHSYQAIFTMVVPLIVP